MEAERVMGLYCRPEIPALGKLKQGTCEFQVNLGYRVKPGLKTRWVGRGWKDGPEV